MDALAGLAKLREPFPANQISQRQGAGRVMLSYVGHAALTDRLLDADPFWTWEPFAISADGLPVIDNLGGMWIRLTVCGVARIGYGDAQGKEGPNAIKECIGDALRNAAMRFGAALDLWHKGELHTDKPDPPKPDPERLQGPQGVMGAVLDSMPPLDAGQKEYFDTLAFEVTQTYTNLGPMKALERVALEKMDNEEWLHLESRLDSKVRSGIKKAGELKREAAKAKT